MSANFKLTNMDGEEYLSRRGWECRWFGVFLHKISGPDPGKDLHDHPWNFWRFVIRGCYAESFDGVAQNKYRYGYTKRRTIKRWSMSRLKLGTAHAIRYVAPNTWTLVIHGRKRNEWGFYTMSSFTHHREYSGLRREITTTYRGRDVRKHAPVS
jgi:hypothetical protein